VGRKEYYNGKGRVLISQKRMNPEREAQKEDWREDFEREVIRRSAVSDEEKVRTKHGEYEPPAYRLAAARERDEQMLTSRELLDLHRLHAEKENPAFQSYYEGLLSRVIGNIQWALDRLLINERKNRNFYSEGEGPVTPYELMQRDLVPKFELLRQKLEQTDPKDHIMWVDEVMHALHIYGPTARYLVRDFEDLTDQEIKDFFDKLSEY